jgi:hypothetical protein
LLSVGSKKAKCITPFPRGSPLLVAGSVRLISTGDKRAPNCRRCEQAGVHCTYPTSRKRASLETKYESLRRKLAASEQADELGSVISRGFVWSIADGSIEGLLDHIEPSVLQSALLRRGKQSETTISPHDASQNLSGDLEQTQVSMIAIDSDLPPVSHPTSLSDPLPSDGQSSGLENDWLDTAAFGSFNDINGMFNFFDAPQIQSRSKLDPSLWSICIYLSSVFGDPGSASAHSQSEDLNITDGNSYTVPFPCSLVLELYVDTSVPPIWLFDG